MTRGADPERGSRRYEAMLEAWGDGGGARVIAPSPQHDAELRDWRARWERLSASPTTIRRLLSSTWQIDLRPVLEAIRARGPAAPTRCSTRSRSSSPAGADGPRPTGRSPPELEGVPEPWRLPAVEHDPAERRAPAAVS